MIVLGLFEAAKEARQVGEIKQWGLPTGGYGWAANGGGGKWEWEHIAKGGLDSNV
jgi:hypothetical protein